MTYKKIVYVSRKEIGNGVRESEDTCPVALALSKHFGVGVDSIIVSESNAYVKTPGGRFYFRHSRSTQRFIKAFDSGKKVKPFSFRLITY